MNRLYHVQISSLRNSHIWTGKKEIDHLRQNDNIITHLPKKWNTEKKGTIWNPCQNSTIREIEYPTDIKAIQVKLDYSKTTPMYLNSSIIYKTLAFIFGKWLIKIWSSALNQMLTSSQNIVQSAMGKEWNDVRLNFYLHQLQTYIQNAEHKSNIIIYI